jgi:hypothetical protein
LRKPELSGPAHDGPFHGMKWRFPEPAQLQRRSPEAAMIMTTSETFVINMVCFYSNCKYGSVPYLCVCVCVYYPDMYMVYVKIEAYIRTGHLRTRC